METMAKKHTSLYIDEALLADAQRLLGTSGVTETVNRALQEARDLELRRGLLSSPFGITEEELQVMRDHRAKYDRQAG
jgi:Arc/MetJ family transcription regulator